MTADTRDDATDAEARDDRGWHHWWPLLAFVAGSFAAAGLATALQGGNVSTFYDQQVTQPPWAPPSWLFGPVWTVLYVLIGVAAWRVWSRAGWTRALTVWVVQLLFNAAWNPAFFGLQNVTLAAAIILVLLGLIAWMMAEMAAVDRLAAWLLAPYAAWVSFATALTIAIWILNPNLR